MEGDFPGFRTVVILQIQRMAGIMLRSGSVVGHGGRFDLVDHDKRAGVARIRIGKFRRKGKQRIRVVRLDRLSAAVFRKIMVGTMEIVFRHMVLWHSIF